MFSLVKFLVFLCLYVFVAVLVATRTSEMVVECDAMGKGLDVESRKLYTSGVHYTNLGLQICSFGITGISLYLIREYDQIEKEMAKLQEKVNTMQSFKS